MHTALKLQNSSYLKLNSQINSIKCKHDFFFYKKNFYICYAELVLFV